MTVSAVGEFGPVQATHNAALEIVSGTTQEDLLLLNVLFGRHFGLAPFAIVASRGVVGESAVKHLCFV